MHLIKILLLLLCGSTLISIGLNFFIVPSQLVDGGMIGLALILNYVWNVKIGTALLVFSVPIFIVVWFYKQSFVYKGILGISITSLMVNVFHDIPFPFHPSPLLSAILGGLFLGCGVGLMFLFNISTDSLDLFALFISHSLNVNLGLIIFILDFLVIGLGFLLMNHDQKILSVIAICAHVSTITFFSILKNKRNNPAY